MSSRPIANAGLDQYYEYFELPKNVTVSAVGSFSPDQRPLTYRWSFISVPQGSAIVDSSFMPSSTSETVGFTADVIGVYAVQLVINDGVLDSRPAITYVSVSSELGLILPSVGQNDWANGMNSNLILIEDKLKIHSNEISSLIDRAVNLEALTTEHTQRIDYIQSIKESNVERIDVLEDTSQNHSNRIIVLEVASTDYNNRILALETLTQEHSTSLATKAEITDVVLLTTNQVISGTKTFSAIPLITQPPTQPTHAVNKQYVDTAIPNIIGTNDRIDVTGGAIDIASSYIGQESITTLGTLTTGTWEANPITTLHGGTGLTEIQQWSVLYGTGGSQLGVLTPGNIGQVLVSDGNDGPPRWVNADLSSGPGQGKQSLRLIVETEIPADTDFPINPLSFIDDNDFLESIMVYLNGQQLYPSLVAHETQMDYYPGSVANTIRFTYPVLIGATLQVHHYGTVTTPVTLTANKISQFYVKENPLNRGSYIELTTLTTDDDAELELVAGSINDFETLPYSWITSSPQDFRRDIRIYRNGILCVFTGFADGPPASLSGHDYNRSSTYPSRIYFNDDLQIDESITVLAPI